ncbi:hypothetical protein [Tepidibacillus marianensis]|uniref:hypothetical protein n=1 Tax=Tepidibacillus marianensis TaxID=3131995 RepID=UPI0030CE54D3
MRLKQSIKANLMTNVSLSVIHFPDESLKKSKWTISIHDESDSSYSSTGIDTPSFGIRSSSKVDKVDLKINDSHPLAAILMTNGNALYTYDNLENKNGLKEVLNQDYV